MKIMESNLFKNQIDRLVNVKGLDRPNSMRLNEYYQALKYITDQDFQEVITYLLTNYKYNMFPQIWDFKQAKNDTFKDPEFQGYGKRDKNYSKDVQKIWNELEIMDVIREQLIPGSYDRTTVKTQNAMYKLLGEMVELGKVFSHNTKKWINKESAINGKYFNPENYGFPVKIS